MENPKGFIRYQIRSKINSNIVYGSYCIPRWIDNKKKNIELWLGRVIDKENNIFYTREHGYYRFIATNNSEDQVSLLTKSESEHYHKIDTTTYPYKNIRYKNDQIPSIISFGSSYFIYHFIMDNNFDSIFNFASTSEYDSILSLIFFKISTNNAYSYAHDWWQTSYCRILFPHANLHSQRISELFTKIGTEKRFRAFFAQYLNFVKQLCDQNTILIDSTGLPNDIKRPLTAINNHNGIISNEIRLIVVMDKVTGFPIYYRYVPGNIVDVSTLRTILSELGEYGLNIDKLVLDAGYYSEENISELYNLKIPFMTRMVKHKGKYELLVKNIAPSIEHPSNLVHYGGRTLFIKKVTTTIFSSDISINAYVCCDPEVKRREQLNYINNIDINKDNNNYFDDQLNFGIFIILTNMDLLPEQILPCYYSRQSVEQLFDYMKNDIDILPARVHSTETFGGHILISFLATIIYIAIDNKLKKSGLSFTKSLFTLNHFYAKVYKTKISPDIKTKIINKIIKALKIKLPIKIDIN
jgi:hypothetical protein